MATPTNWWDTAPDSIKKMITPMPVTAPVSTGTDYYHMTPSTGVGPETYTFGQGALESARWDKNDINWRSKWLTTQQLKGWGNVANEGLYGQSGINEILAGGNQEEALTRAKMLKNYYLQNYSKRLGMRAGGQASNDYMNQYVAPLMLENLKKRQDLIKENLKSRGYGMEQIDKIMQMIMGGGQGTIADTDSGGGWTDWIAPITQIISMIKPAIEGAKAIGSVL